MCVQREARSRLLLGKGRCHSPAKKKGTWVSSLWKKRSPSKAEVTQHVVLAQPFSTWELPGKLDKCWCPGSHPRNLSSLEGGFSCSADDCGTQPRWMLS